MATLLQLLAIVATLHANVSDQRDRCAQIDTLVPGEVQPDSYGLPICGTDSALDGQLYVGQTLGTEEPHAPALSDSDTTYSPGADCTRYGRPYHDAR